MTESNSERANKKGHTANCHLRLFDYIQLETKYSTRKPIIRKDQVKKAELKVIFKEGHSTEMIALVLIRDDAIQCLA